jgi:hypothetical protein
MPVAKYTIVTACLALDALARGVRPPPERDLLAQGHNTFRASCYLERVARHWGAVHAAADTQPGVHPRALPELRRLAAEARAELAAAWRTPAAAARTVVLLRLETDLARAIVGAP